MGGMVGEQGGEGAQLMCEFRVSRSEGVMCTKNTSETPVSLMDVVSIIISFDVSSIASSSSSLDKSIWIGGIFSPSACVRTSSVVHNCHSKLHLHTSLSHQVHYLGHHKCSQDSSVHQTEAS